MTTVRIPLSGSPTNRGSAFEYDQRFVNCFPELIVNPLTQGEKIFLLKRDGTSSVVQPSGAVGEGRGIYSWNSKLYTVVGDKLYSTTGAGVSTAIKTLATSTGAVGFTEFSAANDFLILLDGTDGYYVSTTDLVTKITDVEFPTPHLPYPVFLDGYLFVQKTTGEIFNSDVGDVASWAATSFISPESYPDGAVAICRQNNLLVSVGVWSVEYFYDAANPVPGSPLGRNTQSTSQFGCASGLSIAQEEATLLFVAASATGEKFVVQIEGTKEVQVSTEAVNRVLVGEGSNISDCWGYLTRQKGHLLYVLNLPYQGRTLVYDLRMKMWHEWEWFDGTTDSLFPMADVTEFQDQAYFIHQADGYIYKALPTVYKDSSNVIRVLIQTSRYDGDTSKIKFMDRLEVVGDWQPTSSPLTVYWSDDDYKTWTNERTLDLSKRAYAYRMGSFRRRAFRFYHEANTALRLSELEFELRVGTH
jgi:hypothetical protein